MLTRKRVKIFYHKNRESILKIIYKNIPGTDIKKPVQHRCGELHGRKDIFPWTPR